MAKVYVFRGDDLSPWQFYYDRLVGCRSIYNHPAYVAFLASVYGDPAELFVYDEGDRCVYYPYFKRALDKLGLKVPGGVKLAGRVDFHSSWYYGGPLPSAADLPSNFFGHFVEAFADHAQRAGCVTEFIRFDPNLQNQRLYPLATVSFNRESVYVDLAGRTAEAIWKEFDPTGRYESSERGARASSPSRAGRTRRSTGRALPPSMRTRWSVRTRPRGCASTRLFFTIFAQHFRATCVC